MAKGLIYELAQQKKDSLVYRTERIILELNEKICKIMEEKHISRTDLANRLNTPNAYITKILNGLPNLTIVTLEKIALALEIELKIDFVSKEQKAAIDTVPSVVKRMGAKKLPHWEKTRQKVEVGGTVIDFTEIQEVRKKLSGKTFVHKGGRDNEIRISEAAVG